MLGPDINGQVPAMGTYGVDERLRRTYLCQQGRGLEAMFFGKLLKVYIAVLAMTGPTFAKDAGQ